jgi:predicted DNA-binding transcriptional regulator YafY
MRRADRLFRLVQLLRAGRVLTAARLARELDVSPRTVYRDVDDLVRSGVRIQARPASATACPRASISRR